MTQYKQNAPLGKMPEGVLHFVGHNLQSSSSDQPTSNWVSFLDDALTEGLIYKRLGFIAPLPNWTEKRDVWKVS
jgi:hypothetical protein